eukprot:gene1355-1696_t
MIAGDIVDIVSAGGGSKVLVSLVLTVWAAIALKKNEAASIWMRRLQSALQIVGLVLFSMFWVAVLDYFAFMFTCRWSEAASGTANHLYFKEHNCLAMPHVAYMVSSLIVLLLFSGAAVCMTLTDCDLNPLTRNHLASPMPVTGVKALVLRILMVLLSTCLAEIGRAQSVLMLICAVYITYCLITTVPYFHERVNYVSVGLWSAIVYTCTSLVAMDFTLTNYKVAEEQLQLRRILTNAVLYAVFPVVVVGGVISWHYGRLCRKPLGQLRRAYEGGDVDLVLKDVYRFKDVFQAERLLRVMRKWDSDGVPDLETTAFGEFILKCAMARFPNNPYLMTLYSNFLTEVRKDGSSARTQLQLAAKAGPNMLDRYFIYISQEAVRRIKTDNGMDLIGYVEFQRAYRACVKVHRLALQAQRQFWHSMLRDTVATSQTASDMYKRVMERYPANGRLLKVYGRFLEYVMNDPWGASRCYAEATKLGTEESLMTLTLQASIDAAGVDTATRITAAMGTVDEKGDAIIIINASGIILMLNAGGYRMLGYEKGELEGKNVSTLMPLPFSTRHSSWVQRHATTGKNHILNTMRQVVALHKDRSIVPCSLTVTRISGIGLDSIYMGIMRAFNIKEDGLVKIWALPNGTMMCTNDQIRDCFGINSRDVLGRNISILSTEQDAFEKWIASCSELPPEQVVNGTHKLRTKIIHKYLPPIDAEVTCEFGGSDQVKLLIISMRCLTDTLAMMVTDSKGRIEFATTQLAKMVGYNVKAMTEGMNMAGLLPPPYSQLHPSYMKALNSQPPPSSCRAGAVVHLCHANTTRVPVTLQLSQRDDGDRMQHVIKVIPASEVQLLDQQRVELKLNHKGVVLGVNEHASKLVFGFAPTCLVGRQLSSFINMFSEWRQMYGEDESLLVMLSKRAEQKQDVVIRVGVHNPMTDNEIMNSTSGGRGEQSASSQAVNSVLLSTLQQRRKERPAVMTLKMIQLNDEEEARAATAAGSETMPVLALDLWRAEGLTSLVEVDSQLAIMRAEPTAGLIFGMSNQLLTQANFRNLAGLPAATSAMALLTGSGKKSKSMLKKGAAWRIGPLTTLDANHTDQTALKLQLQAVSKDGKSADRLFVTLHVLESSTGNLSTLQVLKTAGMSNLGDAHTTGVGDAEGNIDNNIGLQGPHGTGHILADADNTAYSGHAFMEVASPKKSNVKVLTGHGHELKGSGHGDDFETASDGEGAASVASSSQSGGDGLEAASSVAGSEADDELVADWRRAKRLKKLTRMMTSTAANMAAARFKKHTYMLTLLILGAHILCFAILYSQVDARFQTAYEVGDMAKGIVQTQMAALRISLVQKCFDPSFSRMEICQPKLIESYMISLQDNYDVLLKIHQGLYLGFNNLKTLRDPRLLNQWTYTLQPELTWLPQTNNNATGVITNGSSTLWEMGNKYLQSLQDVIFNARALGLKLADTAYWNYMYLNGPASIFTGYSWSMDVFVDYAWNQLGTLNSVLVALLVIEALLVSVTAMGYEFLLLKSVDVEAMKRFSVFLTLPTAIIRNMASRMMPVDDDDTSDVDEDELETIHAASNTAGAGDEKQAGGKEPVEAKQSKSVRVRVAADEAVPDKEALSKKRGSSSKPKSVMKAQDLRKPKTFWLNISTIMLAFWVRPNFKVNGKKLVPHNVVLYKFMIPLVLWVCAIIISFGVSFQMLQGLQGPLSSLNAHVCYRLARCRLVANNYAFTDLGYLWRGQLLSETSILRQEYNALLYGGHIPHLASGTSYDDHAPAAAFSNQGFSNIFFKTRTCLRLDKSTCYTPESQWYGITHSGLDAMMMRYLEEMTTFANLPDHLAYPNSTSYEFLAAVASYDLYDGLNEATTLFVDYTISKFVAVKQLHIIMLVITLVAGLLFVFKLFQPHVRSLRTQSKSIAGIMSLLPPEFEIESVIKTQVLGVRHDNGSLHAPTTSALNGTAMPPGSMLASDTLQAKIFGLGRAGSSPLPNLLPLASPSAPARQNGGWRSNQVAPAPADSYRRQQPGKRLDDEVEEFVQEWDDES